MAEYDNEQERGLKGLVNLGNTCYLNSALQVLSHCPPLYKHFCVPLPPGKDFKGHPRRLTVAFSHLLKDLWSCDTTFSYMNPSNLIQNFRFFYPQFKYYQQQDSQEFLRCFLDRLHDELKGQKCLSGKGMSALPDCVPNSEKMSSPSSKKPPTSSQENSKPPVIDKSIISDIFNGQLASSVKCLTCKTVSVTHETFQELSLPIPEPSQVSSFSEDSTENESWQFMSWFITWMGSWFYSRPVWLENCFAAFFACDKLSGENMYSCGKCGMLREGSKWCRLTTPPEVLCLHLKRFKFDCTGLRGGESSKVSTPVCFPSTSVLDLSQYIEEQPGADIQAKYRLTGVICHHGGSMTSGHYTAIIRNHDPSQVSSFSEGSTENESWFEFDDAHVRQIDPSEVYHAEAYVLLYQREPTHHTAEVRESYRQLRENLTSMDKPSPSTYYISRYWLNKFLTFSSPGPIENDHFLTCQHGNISPFFTTMEIETWMIKIPEAVWTLLHEKFGGGPIIRSIIPCLECSRNLMAVEERRNREWTTCQRILEDFDAAEKLPRVKDDDEHSDDVLTLKLASISGRWLTDWENFMLGRTDTPPGEMVTGQSAHSSEGSVASEPIPLDMYNFLLKNYDGQKPVIDEVIRVRKTPLSNVITTQPSSPVSKTACHSDSEGYSNTSLPSS